jgi:hypothetical protein
MGGEKTRGEGGLLFMLEGVIHFHLAHPNKPSDPHPTWVKNVFRLEIHY